MILLQVLKQIHDTKALSYDTCFIIQYIGNWLNCGHRILYRYNGVNHGRFYCINGTCCWCMGARHNSIKRRYFQ